MAPPVLTLDLARRLELHLADGVEIDPDGATVARFGQTIAAKAGGGRPRNKVFGFGRDDLSHLPAILNFYRADRLEPSFYLAPTTFSADVGSVLAKAGFAQQAFEQAILFGVPEPAAPVPSPDISIELLTSASADLYCQTMAEGFEWDPAWRRAAIAGAMQKVLSETDSATTARRFIARFQGEPAGVGMVSLRDGIAGIGMGATVPRFRRRGVHLALLHHRLHVAHLLGAEYVSSGASYGSASFRNQLRVGLQLVHIESEWRRLP